MHFGGSKWGTFMKILFFLESTPLGREICILRQDIRTSVVYMVQTQLVYAQISSKLECLTTGKSVQSLFPNSGTPNKKGKSVVLP
jgi:hypothetical protein